VSRKPSRLVKVSLPLLVAGVLVLAGCGNGGANRDQEGAGPAPGAEPLSDEAQEFLDRGNMAQRDGRYGDALAFYRQAMELAPEHAVPQFGGLMAAMALGDSALADSLRAKLQESSPELLEMLHPGGGMGGGMMMPPDHPPGPGG
jgi:tetratricopeptide (TPR) repeat protein